VLIGDGADNIFYGGDHKDLLIGGAGDDELHGGSGNDTLSGGEGVNALYGGSGKDKFVFGDGVSNILDFSLLDGDKLQLDFDVFSQLSSTNKILDAFAFSTSDSLDFNDVLSNAAILYESGTGDIYYDSNGGTGFDAVHIGSVTGGILLENTNFEII
jgi:Ca2+-binding RTX toxin-like protein